MKGDCVHRSTSVIVHSLMSGTLTIACCVPGSVLRVKDRAMSKTDKVLVLKAVIFQGRLGGLVG